MSANFFNTSARSAIGLVRQGNEDSAFVSPQLIAVADGFECDVRLTKDNQLVLWHDADMNRVAGKSARIADSNFNEIKHRLTPTLTATDIDEDSVSDLLMHSLHSIDEEIAAVAEEEIEKRGMGTTLTALLFRDNHIALLHVGDSRCYRLRGSALEQLSNDHPF